MLKNKKEREEFFRNSANWHVFKSNETYATGIIRVCKLQGYPIIRVSAVVELREPTECILGYYQKLEDSEHLRDIYQKTPNQCVDIMTSCDKLKVELQKNGNIYV